MKFTVALIALLCISNVFAVKLTNSQMQKIDNLKNGNTWGSIMLNLAELHMLGQGPLDELVGAINDLVNDLNAKCDKADQDFVDLTARYQADVQQHNDDINAAKGDISRTETFLSDVLYPQKAQLEQEIVNLQAEIESDKQEIQNDTDQRNKDHAVFDTKISEANDALTAISECFALLETLDGAASLAQVKKVQNSLGKIQKKLGNSVEAAMVKALISLSSQEFANSDALAKVNDLLGKVQMNIQQAIDDWTKEEAAAQAAYEAEIAHHEDEIRQHQLSIIQKQDELDRTNRLIVENEQFLVVRKHDLVDYQQQLDDCNAQYQRDTDAYNDLEAEFKKELDACTEALRILNSAEFAGYLSDRMGSDVIIDTARGTSGIQVF